MNGNMKRALLLIDVQNEYFTGKLQVTYPENSFENILRVMGFANKNNISVLLIQHTNAGKMQLLLGKDLMNGKSMGKS